MLLAGLALAVECRARMPLLSNQLVADRLTQPDSNRHPHLHICSHFSSYGVGVSIQKESPLPQMYPHEVLAAGGAWWTLVEEARAYRYEASIWVLDVYGSQCTSTDRKS